MKTDRPPETVREYLDALQSALKGASPGLISDALADAEEHLQGEIASNPTKTEAEPARWAASASSTNSRMSCQAPCHSESARRPSSVMA